MRKNSIFVGTSRPVVNFNCVCDCRSPAKVKSDESIAMVDDMWRSANMVDLDPMFTEPTEKEEEQKEKRLDLFKNEVNVVDKPIG